ncbi:hypothetical protein IV203_030435 [Nitzschia inconspicua]|uniref:Uncharacterized protein n=1 Tax=Nitzschia inconspicua TaxID=303405 RepID=A0A9K3K3S8_9STRA|nr:hypothetical protein IV203_025032 [Nitzschia inconspicua]KAG7339023.1 hypothetical protein IV203_028360 [Nitzschia inconspicua]KAG7339853.1 hypothetical protein IV203_024903 [Nitzschia inconspicua]KAG7367764.1 hypothetical protein IV203_030435 [Nitzschia inconspicua]
MLYSAGSSGDDDNGNNTTTQPTEDKRASFHPKVVRQRRGLVPNNKELSLIDSDASTNIVITYDATNGETASIELQDFQLTRTQASPSHYHQVDKARLWQGTTDVHEISWKLVLGFSLS